MLEHGTGSKHVIGRVVAATAVLAGLIGVGPAPVGANAVNTCGVGGGSGTITRLGNAVFDDVNDNGIFDVTEVGIDGVTVELWIDVDSDGAFEPNGDDGSSPACSTTTSLGGFYLFYDVPKGEHFVAVPTAPAGTVSSTGSTDDQTTDNVDDGAPEAGYAAVSIAVDTTIVQPLGETAPGGASGDDETAADTLGAPHPDDESNLTIDFGFSAAACLGIGNRVWFDADNDGTFDGGESGIDGVSVQLFAADVGGQPIGSVLDSETTSDGGYYVFSCLDEGRYVAVVAASNFAGGGVLEGMRSATDGTAGTDQQDDGLDPSSPLDRVVGRAVDLVKGGQPTAEPDKPGGTPWAFDDPADDGVDTELDFGFTGLTLGNRVWNDTANPNGVHDVGEPGLSGVTVQLWTSDGTNPTGVTPIATTTTNGNGFYRFTSLAPGSYVVRVPAANFAAAAVLDGWISTAGNGVAPDPDTSTTDRDDNGDANGSDVDAPAITLAAGGEPTGETDLDGTGDSLPGDASANVTVDFGFVDPTPIAPGTASLGDFVWIDANRNGVQDGGETPVPGVQMRLTDTNGVELAVTATSAGGVYSFNGLSAGTYVVCVRSTTLPSGMVATVPNQGGNDTLDSDFGATGCTDPVVLPANTSNTTVDLGLVTASVDLSIVKTGTWSATRNELTWTLAVRNDGSQSEPGSIVITDVLPAGLGTPVFTAPAGTACSFEPATRVVTCTTAASLAAGAGLTVTMVTPRTNAALCSVTNTANVRGTGIDANSVNNVSTTTVGALCSTSPAPNLPVTGTSVAIMVGLALLMTAGGWQLTRFAGRPAIARRRHSSNR